MTTSNFETINSLNMDSYQLSLGELIMNDLSYVVGDINGDGVVDVSDYTGVANHISRATTARL